MTDSHHTLDIFGQAVPLRVRRHARARRLILRLDEKTGGAIVTIPARTAIRDGIDMARRKSAWIAAQLKRQATSVRFAPGISLPLRGEAHTVRHNPDGRGVICANLDILVSGRPEHFARRLVDWLKAQARADITARTQAKAHHIDQCIARITVRDTRSRWGSCGAQGQLNFSWRLVLAPTFVLDYVVAHEVAHLRHHNHGADFWTLTDSLCERMGEAKAWLSTHGKDLHRYGP